MAAEAQHAINSGNPRAADLVEELGRVASRHGMRELQAEAAVFGALLGLPGALDLARTQLSAVDNPAMTERFEQLLAAGRWLTQAMDQ